MAASPGPPRKLGTARSMTAIAIRPFCCICEGCEPLQRIEGLSEPAENEA
ncbi:hypothetical protein EV128_11931 [Rhizobium azibense]|nr:hypothetical protein EV128_11931 [Rhizobium azibense]